MLVGSTAEFRITRDEAHILFLWDSIAIEYGFIFTRKQTYIFF